MIHFRFWEKFRLHKPNVNEINKRIYDYIYKYKQKYNIIIKVNHKYNSKKLYIKCPTCRTLVRYHKKPNFVYVDTHCVCCYNSVDKCIILSCKHANICTSCYKKITREGCGLFITDTGEKIYITDEQIALYNEKKQLGISW